MRKLVKEYWKLVAVLTAYWLVNITLILYKDKVMTVYSIVIFLVLSLVLGIKVEKIFTSQKIVDVMIYALFPVGHAAVTIVLCAIGFILYFGFSNQDIAAYEAILGFTTVLPFVFGISISSIKKRI